MREPEHRAAAVDLAAGGQAARRRAGNAHGLTVLVPDAVHLHHRPAGILLLALIVVVRKMHDLVAPRGRVEAEAVRAGIASSWRVAHGGGGGDRPSDSPVTGSDTMTAQVRTSRRQIIPAAPADHVDGRTGRELGRDRPLLVEDEAAARAGLGASQHRREEHDRFLRRRRLVPVRLALLAGAGAGVGAI